MTPLCNGSCRMRTFARATLAATVIAVMLAVAVVGCARSDRTVARAGGGRLAAQTVKVQESFDGGKLLLDPPAKPADFTDGVRDRIEANQFFAHLVTKGFSPTIEYGDYTDTVSGTPVAGVTPEQAAAMHPSSSELAYLESQPVHLTYDRTPAWIVHFDNLPASAVAMFRSGPAQQYCSSTTVCVTTAAPTTEATPTTSSGRLASGGSTLLIVFSPDAQHALDVRIFPTDWVAPTTTVG